MKKILFTLFLAAAMVAGAAAQSGNKHDWRMLPGKWILTHVLVGEDYVDVSMFPYSDLFGRVTADVRSDGTFKAESNLHGGGSGTYKTRDNKVDCYYNGKLMGTFTVAELTDSHAVGEVNGSVNGQEMTYRFKCRKWTAEDEAAPAPQKSDNPLSKLIPLLKNR